MYRAGATATLLGKTQKNESCFPTLTFKQRMYGFATCFILGEYCSTSFSNIFQDSLLNFCLLDL